MANGLKLKAVGIAMAFLLLTAGIGAAISWEQVDEGNVAVVTEWGGATGEVIKPGADWITPIQQDTVHISTRQQSYTMSNQKTGERKQSSDAIVVPTQDGVPVTIALNVRYHLSSKDSETVDFYSDYKTLERAEQRMIRPTARSEIREVAGGMTTSNIYTGEGQKALTDNLREALTKKASKTGIVIDSIEVLRIDMPESYDEAVTQKEIAQQNELKAEAQVKVATQKAEARVAKSEGKAKANRIVAKSLKGNPELVQIRYIEAIKESDNKVIYLPSDKTPALTKDTEEDSES